MAQTKKKFPPRYGEFRVVEGDCISVQVQLNNLRKEGFVDVKGTTATSNNLVVVVFFKPNTIDTTVPEPTEDIEN